MAKYECLDASVAPIVDGITEKEAKKVLSKLEKYGTRSTKQTKKYEEPVVKALAKYFEQVLGTPVAYSHGNPIKKASPFKKGDGGVDRIIETGTKNIIVQVKCFESKNDPEYVERLITTLGNILYNSNVGVYINLEQESLPRSITESISNYEYKKTIYSMSNIMIAKLIIKYKIPLK